MEPINSLQEEREYHPVSLGVVALFFSLLLGIVTLLGFHTDSSQRESRESDSVTVSSKDPFAISLTGKAAVVYDIRGDQVLFGLHEEAQLPLASLTKLLVAYETLHELSPYAVVPITASALSVEGDSGLYVGDTFSVDTLSRFALVASSNDASAALKEAYERGKESNDQSINQGAASFLSQTYIVNGTGLDESIEVAGGYGSAKDIALLLGHFYEDYPLTLSDTTYKTRSYQSFEGRTIMAKNTDVIAERIPRLLGGKTGFTDLAGGNLAILYDAGIDRPVAIVVLGASEASRFTDVEKLISATESYFETPLTK